jgi:hypothetical protein
MENFSKKLQEKFTEISKSGKLFRIKLTGDQIWNLYINSFSEENNPIFRDPSSTSKNCNHCKNFIRRYGNIVSIDENYNITTMFDVIVDEEFKKTVEILTKEIKKSVVKDIFLETYQELNSLPYEICSKSNSVFKLGVDKNPKRYTKEEAEKFGVVKYNEIKTFHHMHIFLNKEFVDMSGKSVESLMGEYRDAKNVFQRTMETISLDTLKLVKDLIIQGSLLDGTTHLWKIETILPLKEEYDSLPANTKDNWCWIKSYKLPLAKFKNELIGVLCSELSEGEELNKACQSWNKRVDPVNYMKVIAPITQKQIKEAKKFVEENGYIESFDRRFATLNDIKVSEILHSNVGRGDIKTISMFDNIKTTSTRHKRNEFDGIETISIEKFMEDILPGCTSVEAFLKNSYEGNLVSLTTSKNKDSKQIFKWNNNYSWTFNGNLAGKSQIKEKVKSKGGKVDGVLRFSMMWADGNGDNSDLDLHCEEPDQVEIYFNRPVSRVTGGNLDIDIRNPFDKLAVENITFPSLSKMKEGTYKFFINQFEARSSKGFKAEIEFNGELYSYSYDKAVIGKIKIAEVTLKNSEFTINHTLPAIDGVGVTKEIYGLETNQFHKVNLICLSPNHWGENNVGNKHYLFMLENCKSPNAIRSFHNENLLPELAEHRRVLEILAATNMIESTENQLSGLGFNSTVEDELIVKLQGSFKRVLKIRFK